MVRRGNPLSRRIPREFTSDLGKYLVIALLMILMIGEVSGFLVADESMIKAYNESYEKYCMEDGHFSVQNKLNKTKINKISEFGLTLYDLFYTSEEFDNGSSLRIFANRNEIDLPCVMKGRLPEKDGEIAIDRMYADNNGLKVGDVMTSDRREYTVTGLIALPDFSALFESNNDMMFDSSEFGVALIDEETFAGLDEDRITWNYGWKYDTVPADKDEEKDLSEDLLPHICSVTKPEIYIPRFANQAITFTGDDMGKDRVMMQIFLYVVILILAFVFTITISNTIQKESEVIGTLRANGYTRGELLRHYMAVPLVVTILAAIIGNIMGYTFFKDFNAGMYYGSYSLPTFVTVWSPRAFFETTLVPIVIMIVVTMLVLIRKLRFTPLQFLRRDISSSKGKKAIPLSPRIPFFTRYRLRVILQNISSYIVLVFGVFFAYFLLMFGMTFPEILKTYAKDVTADMFCKYQYILTIPVAAVDEDEPLSSMVEMLKFQQAVETETPGAEKFTAYSLQTKSWENIVTEDVTIYGIAEKSKYVPLDITGDEVYITEYFADKFSIKPGDTITLSEEFEDKSYDFTVTGTIDYKGGICLFMGQKAANRMFDLGKSYFSGYFSDELIEDVDQKYIGTVIDKEAMTKVSRQLLISMGDMMYLVDALSVIIFVAVVYLLSKMIIEKNAVSISMAGILGYKKGEIARLYVAATSVVVVVSMAVLLPLESMAMVEVFKMALRVAMHGWFDIVVPGYVQLWMFATGLLAYAVVAALEMKKISAVPMDEALKLDE